VCRQCPLLYAQGGSQIRVVCGTGVDFLRAAEYVNHTAGSTDRLDTK
jgi:hypothetical protein